MEENNHKKLLRPIILICAVVLLLIAAAVGAYFLWEKAPEIPQAVPTAEPKPIRAAAPKTAVPEPTEYLGEGEPFSTVRQDGVYTVLVAGVDELSDSTDTIMLARLDTNEHELNIVSIPRDTLINVDWNCRKINSAYPGSGGGQEGVDALKRQLKRLTGFEPDCYALVNIQLLIDSVDTVGGIDFDVPIRMYYTEGPWIDLEPGPQHLSGEQVLGVLRFRSGYVTGDLGRLETQHALLKAAAEQFIALDNIPNVGRLLSLLSEWLMTDLEPENIAFLMRQVLRCDPEDIHFYTVPGSAEYLHEYSYYFVDVGSWVELLNETLNPFEGEISSTALDIVYRKGDGTYGGTAALRGEWYYPTLEDLKREKAEAEAKAKAEAEAKAKAEQAAAEAPAPESPAPEETEPPEPGPTVIEEPVPITSFA